MTQISPTTLDDLNTDQRITQLLAADLGIAPSQVDATIGLLDGGATVPFIARYRKEATGGLDDTVLRELATRLEYVRELEDRRRTVHRAISEQGKLTNELEAAIMAADTKQRLEDLYAPYRPKRRTRAQLAREAGLEALLEGILNEPSCDPLDLAQNYIDPESNFADARAALNGARDILTETCSEHADLLATLRNYLWEHGVLYAQVIEGKEAEGENFRDWFDFQEGLQRLASHRVLALLRGRQVGVLALRLGLAPEIEQQEPHPVAEQIARQLGLEADFSPKADARGRWLADVSRWAWRVRLHPAFETEFITRLRERAEGDAIRVFGDNVKDLLLAAPAGPRAVLGLDPGIRTGVKVAAIDPTGKLQETATIYPFEPRRDRQGSLQQLAKMVARHHIELIAIGNGTASRETEKLVNELRSAHPELRVTSVVVSEAGASIYSASETAAHEFPDLDVSLRGAVSIARRLQDPLAELVKIEPKAIGVGQYQHDVNQGALARTLDAVVEDCVNAVGVDVNTASAALLERVAGLSPSLASNIVHWRDEHGPFSNRQSLRKVPRFGPKTFEQAAGFLRIREGDNPLDSSAVHPEAYPVVQRILQRIGAKAHEVMGKKEVLGTLSPAEFTDEQFGLPTVTDIFQELEKPGRDPRPEFRTAQFREDVATLNDVQVGMVLEGVVTNVVDFGAFVDIGVGEDGLVHISALADHFVKDPRDIVRVGQTVTVHVIEVDVPRRRMALSMRAPSDTSARQTREPADKQAQKRLAGKRAGTPRQGAGRPAPKKDTAMAAAFARLKK